MMEIIATIIGALVGGLLTWILAKKRPSYIICEEDFSENIVVNLPETRILFRDKPIDGLHITRLKFRNMGANVLKEPVFNIKVENHAKIIAGLSSFIPERGDPQSLVQAESEGNTIKIIPSVFYPYVLNQETLFTDIFTDTKTTVNAVFGNGINNDGTGWSVKFGKKYVELPLLSVYAPANPFARALGLGLYAALIATILLLIGYFSWHVSKGLIILNKIYLESLQHSIVFWIILGVSALVILLSLGFGVFGGAPFPIPLPFKRILMIYIRRRK